MATWQQFTNKDSGTKYLEDLDRQATNQSSDLSNTFFGAYRYWLAHQLIEKLLPVQAEVMGEIELAREVLSKHDPEHPSTDSFDREFVRGATERLKLLQRAQIEIDYALKVMAAIPGYECPQWFYDWAKTVLNDPEPEIVDPKYLGQSPTRKSKKSFLGLSKKEKGK